MEKMVEGMAHHKKEEIKAKWMNNHYQILLYRDFCNSLPTKRQTSDILMHTREKFIIRCVNKSIVFKYYSQRIRSIKLLKNMMKYFLLQIPQVCRQTKVD